MLGIFLNVEKLYLSFINKHTEKGGKHFVQNVTSNFLTGIVSLQ